MGRIIGFEHYQLLFFEFQILPQFKSLLNRLPCDESLWRCRSAKEWHFQWANGQGVKRTLANAMSADDKIQTADSLHGPNIEIFILALYAEERTATEQLAFSPLLHGESKQSLCRHWWSNLRN